MKGLVREPIAQGNATAIERGAMVQQYNFKNIFRCTPSKGARPRAANDAHIGAVIERPNMIAGHGWT